MRILAREVDRLKDATEWLKSLPPRCHSEWLLETKWLNCGDHYTIRNANSWARWWPSTARFVYEFEDNVAINVNTKHYSKHKSGRGGRKTWTPLKLSSWRGWTLPQIALQAPGTFCDDDFVHRMGKSSLAGEFAEVRQKSRNIRLPRLYPSNYVFVHQLGVAYGNYGFDIMHPRTAEHVDAGVVWIDRTLDLMVGHDRWWCDDESDASEPELNVMKSFSKYFRKDPTEKWSTRECGEFFNNNDNFALPSAAKSP